MDRFFLIPTCGEPAAVLRARALSRLFLFLILLTALLLLFTSNVAIAQDSTATILGNVTDPTGAEVPKAAVAVTNLETNVTVNTMTTDSGAYTVPNLNPGNYSVVVKMSGFQTASITNLTVSAGDRRRADATLVVGAANETVEITTAAPVLQTDTSSIGSNVSNRAVQDLPLNGRNFINLAQIIPGATEGAPNSISSGTRPDDRRPTSSVSINGQSEVLNDQLVDGLDNNERVIGTIGVRPAIERDGHRAHSCNPKTERISPTCRASRDETARGERLRAPKLGSVTAPWRSIPRS